MKTIIITLIIILLGAAIYAGIQGLPKFNIGRTPEYSVFYEQAAISKFDGGGNPVGRASIVRVDGLNGRPKPLFELKEDVLSGGNVRLSASGLEAFEAETYDAMSGMITAWTKKELDLGGRVLKVTTERAMLNENISGSLTSPNGKYDATWTMVCLEEVEEGPCPWRFKLDVKDFENGVTKSFGPKDFSLTDEQNMYVKVLGFSANSDKLYAIIYIVDDVGPGNLAALNLAAGTVNVLEANVLTGPADQQFFVQPLRKKNTTRNFYYINNFLSQTTDELIRLDAVTGERAVIMEFSSADEPRIAPNELLIAYGDEFNKGFFIYNTQSKSTQRVVSQGEFLAWAGDSRHVAYQVFATNNGLGPKKLYVRNIKTGQERLIFDQIVVAQGSDTTTKVGDRVYSFIGIQ